MRSPHTFQQFSTRLSIPLLIHSSTVKAAGHLLSSIPLSPIIRLGKGLVTRQNITPTSLCFVSGVFLVHFLRAKHCRSRTPSLWRPGGRGRQAPVWGGSRTRANVFLLQTLRDKPTFSVPWPHLQQVPSILGDFPGFAS